MKLHSLKLPDLPYLGSLSHVIAAAESKLTGWVVKVRADAVFLESPPGWMPALSVHQRDPKGPKFLIGPLNGCVLLWTGDGDVDALRSIDSEPLGPKVVVQMSDDELERVTAPKGKVAGGR